MTTSATPRPQARLARRHAPPRPFGDGGEVARKPLAAGHVLIVGLICLIVGWLLNAPGIEKTAYAQPLGWQRDVALFFAKPMASLSNFLHTDRPRQWLKDGLGRGDDDHINTKLPSPTSLSGAPTTPSTTIEAFSPQKPLRMWVGGDSLSFTPGESIENFAGGTEGVVVPTSAVDGVIATGLARPEVFNWPEHLTQVIAEFNPSVMVLTIGSNDDQSLTGAPGGRTVGPFGSPEWEAEYRRRVGGLMDQVVSTGRKLVWVGNPPLRNFERSESRYKLINNIFKTEAAKRPGRVFYVDIYGVFLDNSGAYADYLPNINGEAVKVRADDGTHFTRAGGDRVAIVVYEQLGKGFDLDSWKKKRPTTTTPAPPATNAP